MTRRKNCSKSFKLDLHNLNIMHILFKHVHAKNFRVFPWKGILSKLCLLYQRVSTPLSKQIHTVPLSDLPR